MFLKAFSFLKQYPAEAVIWMIGLFLLAIQNPHEAHFSVCPFSYTGWDFCPGCGLGRSVSLLFHGKVVESLAAHPLGIFAVIVLSYRIINLSKQHLKSHGKNY